MTEKVLGRDSGDTSTGILGGPLGRETHCTRGGLWDVCTVGTSFSQTRLLTVHDLTEDYSLFRVDPPKTVGSQGNSIPDKNVTEKRSGGLDRGRGRRKGPGHRRYLDSVRDGRSVHSEGILVTS